MAAGTLELTLILAATTRDMGIGLNGMLPWTGLCREMAYFVRATTRMAGRATAAAAAVGEGDAPKVDRQTYDASAMIRTSLDMKKNPEKPRALNAVIMGRKTWDSIPTKSRPLKDRLNIVISRSFPPFASRAELAFDPSREPLCISSLEEALAYLQDKRCRSGAEIEDERLEARVFVIGGAQVYDAALAMPETRRVLLTRVLRDFACDTFVGGGLAGELGGQAVVGRTGQNKWMWRKCTKEEHDRWMGEQVPPGVQEENGTKYEFEMWEKVG